MKTLLILTVCMLVSARAIAEAPSIAGPRTIVEVKVLDDLGAPVAGADVAVSFRSYERKPSDTQHLQSDAAGVVKTEGNTPLGVSIYVTKPGHYEARSEPYISFKQPIERTYVLPRVLNPIPLFAARIETLNLPIQNEWLGYDFEARDWIAPHGKGKHSDIRFKYRNQFV